MHAHVHKAQGTLHLHLLSVGGDGSVAVLQNQELRRQVDERKLAAEQLLRHQHKARPVSCRTREWVVLPSGQGWRTAPGPAHADKACHC